MRPVRDWSLRTKLVGVFLIPTLVTVLLYGVLAFMSARRGLESELGHRLTSIGRAVSAELSEGLQAKLIDQLEGDDSRVRERLRNRLQRVMEATDLRRMYLFDRELGRLVDTDGPKSFGDKIYKLERNRFEIEKTFEEGEATTSVLFQGDDGTYYKSAYVPIELDGEVVAALAVEAGAGYFGTLRQFASALTLLGAVGIGLVVLVGTLFARGLTRPLNRLVDAARRLGEGELDEPIVDSDLEEAKSGDEIDFLSAAFEEMRRDLRQRDRQMQMMLSGIAHEVKNPLGGMELFCGLLREDLEERGDEEAVEKVERIERELDYLERVVDEFRTFATDEEVELERFDAAEMLDEIAGLMEGDDEAAGCELTVEVGEDLEFTGDRDQLKRAILNLVRNACQACEEGERVEVYAEAPTDDRRRIVVEDDGPGISEEVREDLFTPFYTTKEQGSGLGLPLSKKIVERHDGALTLDSEVGEGTRVTVEWPFDDSVEASDDVPDHWLG